MPSSIEKLTVIGASGRTGMLLVAQALDAGVEVVAFARSPEKIPLEHPSLCLLRGDVRDGRAVAEAIEASGAVLSALSQTDAPDNTADLLTVAADHIIAGMTLHGVRRLVFATGAGVRAPQDQPTVTGKIIESLLRTLSRRVYEDALAAAALVGESDLAWTITRAPRLIDGPGGRGYEIGFVGPAMELTLSRVNMAAFMLAQAGDDTYLYQMPVAWDLPPA